MQSWTAGGSCWRSWQPCWRTGPSPRWQPLRGRPLGAAWKLQWLATHASQQRVRPRAASSTGAAAAARSSAACACWLPCCSAPRNKVANTWPQLGARTQPAIKQACPSRGVHLRAIGPAPHVCDHALTSAWLPCPCRYAAGPARSPAGPAARHGRHAAPATPCRRTAGGTAAHPAACCSRRWGPGTSPLLRRWRNIGTLGPCLSFREPPCPPKPSAMPCLANPVAHGPRRRST